MTVTQRLARVAHAIPGRLRLRLEGEGWTPETIEDVLRGLDGLRRTSGILDVRLNAGARSAVIRYDPTLQTEARVLAAVAEAGAEVVPPGGDGADAVARATIPTIRFDRRLVGNLAISGVSLYAARQVGAAVGGAAVWPAYFAIWFALRRVGNLATRDRPAAVDAKRGTPV